MTPFTENLRRIRWNLVLLLLLVLLGAASVLASRQYAGEVQLAHRQALEKRNVIQEKLAHARDEEQELRQKFSRYQNILARGYIGNEHRLDWIEQIRKIKTARKLLDVQYELAPQRMLDGNALNPAAPGSLKGDRESPGKESSAVPGASANAGSGNVSGYDFMVSNMHLQMQLLHEEDLLNFLADLQDSMRAYLRVNQCDVQRQSFPGSAAQLKAECSIDWITLRERIPG